MHQWQAGVDIGAIVLCHGQKSLTTTHHRVEADLAMKECALATLRKPEAKIQRYRPSDSLISFPKTL